jgi:hypothetical protein
MNGSLGGEQFGLGEQEGRALSALAAELSPERHHLLLVVPPQFLLDVAVLLVQPTLLLSTFLRLLVHPRPDLLLQGCHFRRLSRPQRVDGRLYLEAACVEPGILLGLLQFCQSRLHLVSLVVTE